VGNLFGFGAGETASSNDIPFFLYAVLNDSENAISFMISRQAGRTTSPASGDIGKTGSAVADNVYSFFALSNPTVTDYDANPCICIGSFRMRLTTSGGDWTVQALAVTDGIGEFQDTILFDMPVAVFGAAASTHWLANGGTAPILNGVVYKYTVNRNGYIDANYQCTTPSTNGVGAVAATLAIPMPPNYGAANTMIGSGRFVTALISILTGIGTNAASTSAFTYVNASSGSVLNNADATTGMTQSQINFRYQPRTS
jgi:hypothetical protein